MFTVPHLDILRKRQLSPEKRNRASSWLPPPSCSLGLGTGPLNVQVPSNTGCGVPSQGTDETLLPTHPCQDQPALDPRAAHHGPSRGYVVLAAFLPPAPHPVADNSRATAATARRTQPSPATLPLEPPGSYRTIRMAKSKVNPACA